MWVRAIAIVAFTVTVGALAGVAFAQLADSRTASGGINITNASADLYVCEPGGVPGPDCGADDNQEDEAVFETLEDMKPGDLVEWDIRLKNVGGEVLMVSDATLVIRESADLGEDCPNNVLRDADFGFGPRALRILGKSGDPVNDNLTRDDFPQFPAVNPPSAVALYNIKIKPGDYEDVRLGLSLAGMGVEKCDGNRWQASWKLTVVPVSP